MSVFTVFLKNKKNISNIRRSKGTDYAALTYDYIYFRLSGLSPFAGEDDLETLQNVKSGDWDFDADAFSNVSSEGRDFIKKLLIKTPQYVYKLLITYSYFIKM